MTPEPQVSTQWAVLRNGEVHGHFATKNEALDYVGGNDTGCNSDDCEDCGPLSDEFEVASRTRTVTFSAWTGHPRRATPAS